ncbi:MAG TPA: peptide deformylase [Thermoanaerobaculia bacterium]|jgi:peptide deformylase|nr:peptide deformylase [Thermoanaerobaculia bacterium]
MILPIRKYGDDVLRQPTQRIDTIDASLHQLIEDMIETMYAAPGVGLAANQVGVSKQLMIIDLSVGKRPGECHVFINPEIVETVGEVTEEEGCLSIPDFVEVVTRPERVRLRYLDRNGEQREMWGEGLMARAMCHEIDHLQGTLFVDYLRGFRKDRILKKIAKLAKSGMWF